MFPAQGIASTIVLKHQLGREAIVAGMSEGGEEKERRQRGDRADHVGLCRPS